jgi:hypothetical protein
MTREAHVDRVVLLMEIYSTTYSRNRDNARLFSMVSDSQASAFSPSLMANARPQRYKGDVVQA